MSPDGKLPHGRTEVKSVKRSFQRNSHSLNNHAMLCYVIGSLYVQVPTPTMLLCNTLSLIHSLAHAHVSSFQELPLYPPISSFSHDHYSCSRDR